MNYLIFFSVKIKKAQIANRPENIGEITTFTSNFSKVLVRPKAVTWNL